MASRSQAHQTTTSHGRHINHSSPRIEAKCAESSQAAIDLRPLASSRRSPANLSSTSRRCFTCSLRRARCFFLHSCRCTTAHEYIFLLSKGPKYFFDSEAIKEEAVGKSLHDLTGTGYAAPGQAPNTGNRKALRTDIESRHRSQIKGGQSLQAEPDGRRNRRSVWTVATQPYSGAHFAVFPAALIEPCVLAGSRPVSIFMVVDLPQPFEPRKPKISPRRMFRSTACRAWPRRTPPRPSTCVSACWTSASKVS